MIVGLLLLIVAILLFGAGVVKVWLANIFGFGVGGLVLLVTILNLSSYLGGYGVLLVLVSVIGVVVGGLAIGIFFEDRAKQKLLNDIKSRSLKPSATEPLQAHKVWGLYVRDIRERFSPEARNRARAFYAAEDAVGLERLCQEEVDRLNQHRDEERPAS